VINLIQSDVGRPVGHIVSNLKGYDSLVEDVKTVLDRLIPREIEVQTLSGAWFLMRIRPYRTLENVIEGAVITFVDISDLKKAQEILREKQELQHLAMVVRDSHDAILVINLDGRILAWNPAATRLYGWSEGEALKMNIAELLPEASRNQAMESLHSLSKSTILEPYSMPRINKNGRTMTVSLMISMLVNDAGDVYAISSTEREQTAPPELATSASGSAQIPDKSLKPI
jgi:two-component system CheB/CheR fusion protein